MSNIRTMERWMPIPGWECFYEVSDFGRVRSKIRTGILPTGGVRAYGGDTIKSFVLGNGYLAVNLTCAGRRKQITVHRAVLLAFVGHPKADQEACHNDGNRSNAMLNNLRWDTRRANHADKKIHGTNGEGEKNPFAKLSEQKARRIKYSMESVNVLLRDIGISKSQIARIRNGVAWRHL